MAETSQAQRAGNYPITAQQRQTAQQVAQRGVPVGELAPDAPDLYTVKRGDTLWGISGIFLRSPWRWPELWGMNMQQIRNPHLIYPGQTLYLIKLDGYARLSTSLGDGSAGTVRLTPQARAKSMKDLALTTLRPDLIEPFLSEPLVVEEQTITQAPRIVAALQDRFVVGAGDRAYARSSTGDMLKRQKARSEGYRIFHDAVPLKDPVTGEILGYEAQYVGRANLRSDEYVDDGTGDDDKRVITYRLSAPPPLEFDGLPDPYEEWHRTPASAGSEVRVVPAIVDIVKVKGEVGIGDRLLPEPAQEYMSYVPRKPDDPALVARVVSFYSHDWTTLAASNQVIAINKGSQDGVSRGYVFSLISEGPVVADKTRQGGNEKMKLPSEFNGHAMVFRVFDRVSYALILESKTGVKIGDKLISPE